MDKSQAEPADTVHVTVRATPQSTAYLLAVDHRRFACARDRLVHDGARLLGGSQIGLYGRPVLRVHLLAHTPFAAKVDHLLTCHHLDRFAHRTEFFSRDGTNFLDRDLQGICLGQTTLRILFLVQLGAVSDGRRIPLFR